LPVAQSSGSAQATRATSQDGSLAGILNFTPHWLMFPSNPNATSFRTGIVSAWAPGFEFGSTDQRLTVTFAGLRSSSRKSQSGSALGSPNGLGPKLREALLSRTTHPSPARPEPRSRPKRKAKVEAPIRFTSELDCENPSWASPFAPGPGPGALAASLPEVPRVMMQATANVSADFVFQFLIRLS
jgi:hypothetical protein